MLEEIMTKVAQMAYPGRNAKVVLANGKSILIFKTIRWANYKLEGKFSYRLTEYLNQLTEKHSVYGYSNEIGPIAFIGLSNKTLLEFMEGGKFEYKIRTYGDPIDATAFVTEFEVYSKSVAPKIGNYTVYGLGGIREVEKKVNIEDLNYLYDSRYMAKSYTNPPRVYSMDAKLEGVFSYTEALHIATGVLKDRRDYTQNSQIVFGKLEDGERVGLLGVWPTEVENKKILGFKNVWQRMHQEPETELIEFFTDDEAKEYNDYSLYIYRYCGSIIKNIGNYRIEKFDKTLDKKFNYHLADGTDYRLIPHEPC